MLRSHILICLILLVLTVPVYILDNNSLKSNGRDWVSLDLRGLFIWPYVLFIGIYITLSTLGIIYYHRFKLFQIHLFSAFLSIAILGIGLLLFDKLAKYNSAKKSISKIQKRKSLFNDVQLNRWWFVPNANDPKEIHVDLEVIAAGRFAGLATGKEDGEYGKNIFSSDGEVQHPVKAGEHIHYIFPLKIINPGQAKNIEFTFYLFKGALGEASDGDIIKIFKDSIVTNDDGSYFYEPLMPPLKEIHK